MGDTAIVRADWNLVRSHMPEVASKIFSKLFHDHPDVLEHQFINLAGIPRDHLVDVAPTQMHATARQHAMTVVNKVTEIVNHLGNASRVEAAIVNLGKDHANRPLTEAGLSAFKTAMLDVLQEHLHFGADHRSAWDNLVGDVTSRMWKAIEARRKVISEIRSDWSKADRQSIAVNVFHAMFTKHPQYTSQFVNLRSIPKSELATATANQMHPGAKALAVTVMNKVTELMKNLDNADIVSREMAKLGRDHAHRPLTRDALRTMKDCLVTELSSSMKMNDTKKEAWNFELTTVITHMWKAISHRRSAIKEIKNQWVMADQSSIAVKTFHTFFTRHPNYLESQFTNLKGVPQSKLVDVKPHDMHPIALAHSQTVVNKIGELIDQLDNAATVEKVMRQMGLDHANRPLTEDALKCMKDAFVDTVTDALGLNAEQRSNWDHEVTTIVVHMWRAIMEQRAANIRAEATWAAANHERIANRVFHTLFSRRPDLLENEFTNLSHIRSAELTGCEPDQMHETAKAHARVVVNKISEIVTFLGDGAKLAEEVLHLGQNHADRPLTMGGLHAMRGAMVDVLVAELQLNASDKTTWETVINHVTTYMWAGISKARAH